MNKKILNLAFIPLLALSNVATATNSNLIQNGSFESNPVSLSLGWDLFSGISHWGRTGAQFEIQTNRLGIMDAASGIQYLELDSVANYSIHQDFQTEIGQNYELSFYYSPRVEAEDDSSTTNDIDVYWNDEVVANLHSVVRGWNKFTYKVKATSTTTILKFAGTGTSDSVGGFIDDVKVTATCTSGLYGVNKFADTANGEAVVYYFDVDNQTYSALPSYTDKASNLASHNGTLYILDELDKATRSAQIVSFNLANDVKSLLADTTSFPIYRSAMNPDGLSLRATSKTYMYDFDLATGNKTVLGKLTYPGESFRDGDIAYSPDGSTLYVLTGESLYTFDEGTFELTKVGDHGLTRSSGLAIAPDGKIYASSRVKGENAKIYMLNQNTADATFVMSGPAHVNDLAFVNDNTCN